MSSSPAILASVSASLSSSGRLLSSQTVKQSMLIGTNKVHNWRRQLDPGGGTAHAPRPRMKRPKVPLLILTV